MDMSRSVSPCALSEMADMTLDDGQAAAAPDGLTGGDHDMSRRVRELCARSDDRGLRRPGAEDIVILCRLLPRLLAVRLMLWRLGYRSTYALIETRSASTGPAPHLDERRLRRAVRTGRLVNGLARRLPLDAACLVRSLAAWWLLRRDGVAAELRIGVATEPAFRAHAWLELFGEPITDRPEAVADFAAFDRSGP